VEVLEVQTKVWFPELGVVVEEAEVVVWMSVQEEQVAACGIQEYVGGGIGQIFEIHSGPRWTLPNLVQLARTQNHQSSL